MPQNETHELKALSLGVAGLLRRRRGLGLRRISAIPAPAPPAAPKAAPNAAPATAAPAPAAPVERPPARDTAPTPYTPPTATKAPPTAPDRGSAAAAAPPAVVQALDLSGYGSLAELAEAAQDCRACGLSKSRRNAFAGFGTGSSGVLFIDETPGAAADAGESPLQGPTGELLTNIITKGMGLPLDAVRLASLVQCQPAAGSPPEPSELSTCRSWLERQLDWLDPKVIVTLGRPAATAVLGVEAALGSLRGEIHTAFGRQVVVTYHPEYLVRSPQFKKQAWEDIQLAMTAAGIPLPSRK